MKMFDDTVSGEFFLPKYTLFLAGGVALLYFLLPLSPPTWIFDRSHIESGAYWRLISGHLVHTDGQHLAWNLAALVLLGAVIERCSVALFWISLLFGIVAVDIGIYWAVPGLEQYCGLSGVLNTLWIVALGIAWKGTYSWVVPLAGLAGACKLAVEKSGNIAVFTDTAWPPLVESHIAGQIAGLVILSILVVPKTTVGKVLIGETL